MYVTKNQFMDTKQISHTRGESADSWLFRKGKTWDILLFSNWLTPEVSGKGTECLLFGVLTEFVKRQKRYWKDDSMSLKWCITSELIDSTRWGVTDGALRIRTNPDRRKFAIWDIKEEEKAATFILLYSNSCSAAMSSSHCCDTELFACLNTHNWSKS